MTKTKRMTYGRRYDQSLVEAFRRAMLFNLEQVKKNGWAKVSLNYLREHARCATGLKFSNTISPDILREVARQYPELRDLIESNLGTLKQS